MTLLLRRLAHALTGHPQADRWTGAYTEGCRSCAASWELREPRGDTA